MYAVQNETEIKFNIVLYVIFVGQGWVYNRPITEKRKSFPMMIS